MRKSIMIAVALSALAIAPAMSLADTVVVSPEVDTWIMQQPDEDNGIDLNLAIGAPVPDTVKIIEVPSDTKYAYVVVHKKRYLLDRGTRRVIKVYE